MPYRQTGDLLYYFFDLFDPAFVDQAVFTRQGGVSPAPFASLNVGGNNGDERRYVVENRRRMFAAFGRPVESLFDVWQVHSATAVVADRPRPLDEVQRQADIILTDRQDVTLFMRFGDCVPILLHDPVKKVVCLAHAGWMGTVKKVPAAAVEAMTRAYGSRPEDILAGIGPSVGMHHYEVGGNVIEAVRRAFDGRAEALLVKQNGSIHFDLWQANRLMLEDAGVRQIQVSGECTVCDLENWFSHRGEHGKTGRFGALMALK